jgi:hypothetical protein
MKGGRRRSPQRHLAPTPDCRDDSTVAGFGGAPFPTNPYARFRRSLLTGNLGIILPAVAELERLALVHALKILVVLAESAIGTLISPRRDLQAATS